MMHLTWLHLAQPAPAMRWRWWLQLQLQLQWQAVAAAIHGRAGPNARRQPRPREQNAQRQGRWAGRVGSHVHARGSREGQEVAARAE